VLGLRLNAGDPFRVCAKAETERRKARMQMNVKVDRAVLSVEGHFGESEEGQMVRLPGEMIERKGPSATSAWLAGEAARHSTGVAANISSTLMNVGVDGTWNWATSGSGGGSSTDGLPEDNSGYNVQAQVYGSM
jgi:hypothetical protein